MIRWYDYIVCLLAADFLGANLKIAFFAQDWFMNVIGIVAAWSIYYLFTDVYTPYRYKQEHDV